MPREGGVLKPKMIVVDASVVVDILLGVPGSCAIERRLFEKREPLHAPALIDLEVIQGLGRFIRRGELADKGGKNALEDFSRFPIRRRSFAPLLERVWTLRHTLTAYHAAYLALAEGLGATLLTRDAALAAASGHAARIELV